MILFDLFVKNNNCHLKLDTFTLCIFIRKNVHETIFNKKKIDPEVTHILY